MKIKEYRARFGVRIIRLEREEKLITEQKKAKIISTMNQYDSLPEHETNKLMRDIFNISVKEDMN